MLFTGNTYGINFASLQNRFLPGSAGTAITLPTEITHVRTPPASNVELGVNPQTTTIIRTTSWGKQNVMTGMVQNGGFHGPIGMKEDGTPSWKPTPLPPGGVSALSAEENREAHRGYCFNSRTSDSLSLDRDTRDFRIGQCKREHDIPAGTQASIVMVFHNELLSVLLRSVHSVLNRSPDHLIKEIILLNDASNATTHPWLYDELPEHVKYLPKTHLHTLDERGGLMVARIRGAEHATGDILIFLDSHIEATQGWIEPLMEYCTLNPHAAATPIVGTIDAQSFRQQSGGLSVLGFSWGLGQTGVAGRRSPPGEPQPSPIMSGGLFGINREWFFEVGAYDEDMRLYGGEEMEFSFRLWQCGGSVVNIPCSNVGHVFRTSQYWQGQVYKVPGEEIHRNKIRAATAWMDDYANISRLVIPVLDEGFIGNIDKLKAIRTRLQCKSFEWYLENVYPEKKAPNIKGAISGDLESQRYTAQCIDTMGNQHGGAAGLYPCHRQHGTQAFLLDGSGVVRIAMSDFETCICTDLNSISRNNDVAVPVTMSRSCCASSGNNNNRVVYADNMVRVGARCMFADSRQTIVWADCPGPNDSNTDNFRFSWGN